MNNPEKCKIGGKKNKEFILKNFNWNTYAEKFYKAYSELSRKK